MGQLRKHQNSSNKYLCDYCITLGLVTGADYGMWLCACGNIAEVELLRYDDKVKKACTFMM